MVATKVKGTVTKLRKSRYFKRLSKFVSFKSLLGHLDGSSLLDIVRQVVSQTRDSDRKRTFTEQTVLGDEGMTRRRRDDNLRHRLDETSTVVFYVDWC